MNYNSRFIFPLSFSVIFLTLYRTSWFPFKSFLIDYIYVIIFFIFILLFVASVDFDKFLRIEFYLYRKDFFYLNILIFLLIIVFVFFNSGDLTSIKGVFKVFSYIATFCIFYVILPKFLIFHPYYFEKFIKYIFILGSFTAIFGFFVLFAGISPLERFKTLLTSYITHPNNVSIIFTYTTITSLFYFYITKKRNSFLFNSFVIFLVFVQLAAQFFSLTRAGMIACLFSFFIFLFVVYRNKMIIIVPLIVFTLSSVIVNFFIAKGFDSFLSRFLLLIPAYNMITASTQSLLWGYGVVNVNKIFQGFMVLTNVLEQDIEDPHNSWVFLIMMFGILVTLLIIYFIFKQVIVASIKLFEKLKNNEIDDYRMFYVAYLLSIILSLMLHGLFDAELVKTEFYSIQIFLVSISLLHRLNRDNLIAKFDFN